MVGDMDEPDLSESIWARGRTDTKRCLHSPWFWGVEVIGGGVAGAITGNPWVSLVFIIGFFMAIWIAVTLGAPFRQRNEARKYAQSFKERPLVINFDPVKNESG